MEQQKKKRKMVAHNVDILVRIFNENGGEKNYEEITRLYNEEMGNEWTQDQITKKMQNIRHEIKRGKYPQFQLDKASNNGSGKKTSQCHFCGKLSLNEI